MAGEYKTLREAATDEYIIHKSRFLCHAAPVQTEEAALAFLNEKRRQYRDANHNCYAYVIGKNAGIMRYSDDGEPGGTAGMPMMEVLKTQGVVDCCVVVTRYFGGILLGAGGLVRAYSHSCALAVKKAGVVVMLPSERWLIDVPYPMWDKVSHTLAALPVQTEQTEFLSSVQATLLIRQRDAQDIMNKLTQETNARMDSLLLDELYAAWNENQDE